MSRIIKCEHCGVEFEAKTNNAKYCSKSCWRRDYCQKNFEKIKEYKSQWDAKWFADNNNREKNKIANAKWLANNREKNKITCAKWKKQNLEKYRAIKRRQVYRRLGYPEELLEIKELQYQIKKEIKNQPKD